MTPLRSLPTGVGSATFTELVHAGMVDHGGPGGTAKRITVIGQAACLFVFCRLTDLVVEKVNASCRRPSDARRRRGAALSVQSGPAHASHRIRARRRSADCGRTLGPGISGLPTIRSIRPAREAAKGERIHGIVPPQGPRSHSKGCRRFRHRDAQGAQGRQRESSC